MLLNVLRLPYLTQFWILSGCIAYLPFFDFGAGPILTFSDGVRIIFGVFVISAIVTKWRLGSFVIASSRKHQINVVLSGWTSSLGVAIVETVRLVDKMFMQVRTKVGGPRLDPYMRKDRDVDLCRRHLKWMGKTSGWFFPLLVWHRLICVTASPLSASPQPSSLMPHASFVTRPFWINGPLKRMCSHQQRPERPVWTEPSSLDTQACVQKKHAHGEHTAPSKFHQHH